MSKKLTVDEKKRSSTESAPAAAKSAPRQVKPAAGVEAAKPAAGQSPDPAKPTVAQPTLVVPEPETPKLAVDGRKRGIIEGVTPELDGGRFAIKRTVGDMVTVEADIFTDGHDALSCLLQYRKAG